MDLVRTLGADHVIDYAQTDFTRNGQQYDLILGANGHHSIFEYKRSLTPKGTYVMSGGSEAQMFQALVLGPLISESRGRKLGAVSAKALQEDLSVLKRLLEQRKVVPVIDRRYPLAETAEAFRYLESGHAKGKVVITIHG
jgi:NADPH:quinone reductase-like Zn-dependent oxidoreductase